MGDGGLAVAQVGGDRNQPGGVDETPGALLPSDHLETQHRAEALLLPLGQLVLRMARQASVEHPLDARLLFQPFGQYLSAGTMSLHAQA